MSPRQGVRLDSQLPPTIKALQEGWAATSRSSSVVSALFASVGAQMHVFLTQPTNYTHRQSPAGALTFIALLSYATIIFNASAAITSFIVMDTLSEMPFRSARFEEEPYPERAIVNANQTYLLERYGIRGFWQPVIWHWLFSFLAGVWCLILEIVTYVLMQEPDVVRIPITCVTGFAVLPLVIYVVPSVMSRGRAQSGQRS